jgi:hypothetical protein
MNRRQTDTLNREIARRSWPADRDIVRGPREESGFLSYLTFDRFLGFGAFI